MKSSLWQNLLFVALLGSSTVLLPACGGNAVKSSDESTTMMNPEATPQPAMASEDQGTRSPIRSYVEKAHHPAAASQPAAMASAPTPMPTLAVAATTPVVETPAPAQKGGSHFLWWLLLLLILAGIGWYFWSKNHNDEDEFQPHPPSGGLSPVSGYTGTKELEEKKTPSIWTRKLF
ncbi:MAG TPA: hypothetical protein VFR02_08380 [bacterium]|nr:hypothetical protein [bacterium]